MSELPQAFLEKVQQFVPQDRLTSVMESFSMSLVPSFRVNTLKTSLEIVQQECAELGFIIDQIPWYADAFLLKNKSIRELTATPLYTDGCIYIQNLSSMIPALVLRPTTHDIVLDIAAAPGSKTTQMATLMKNEGLIVANDISRQRLFRLQSNLEEQGITNTRVVIMRGEDIWKRYPEYFDKTLVDAPCTMEGRFHTDNPKSYIGWTQRKVRELATRQQYLLRSAISATKVGGTIVYSTCTLSPEENEGVIDWICKKEKDAIEIEPITIDGLDFEKGLTKWNKSFDERVSNTARIYPSEKMEGFFIAKIKKVKTTV